MSEFDVPAHHDEDDLFVRVVDPVGRRRMRVAVVHGFAEHGGRYTQLARELSAAGAEVHLLDLHGHGRSPGVRGLIPSEAAAVAAVVSLLEGLQGKGIGVAAVGHSFGGALVLRAAQLRPDLLDAVVASAPYLETARPEPGWLLALASFAGRFAPRVRTMPIDSDVVSTLRDEVDAYDDDPLVDRGGVRLGSSRVLHELGPRVLREADRLVTPTLLLHGSEDRLAAPEGSRSLYVAAGGRDVEVREIPGAVHGLLHDAEADRVRGGIVSWLQDRLDASASDDGPPA